MRVSLPVSIVLLASTTVLSAEDDRPNFILCMADDQGWGDVGYYGHPVLQTPVLDEMAAAGLRLDRFYAAHPVCSPTRGSVMTGRNPNRFACFSWGHTLRPEEVTVAEALRDAGYATGHFGKWHLGSVRAEDPVSPGGSGFDEWMSTPNFYENSPLFSHRGTVVETEGESSAVTVEAALEFIRSCQEKDQPFLAVIWFGNPHTPHEALPELRALYPDATKAEQNYYGEITGIDRAMGLLRSELQQLGVSENTLLWYTSDNGPQGKSPGSSGGLRGAKASLWEGGIRVPTIIEWPARITAPRVSDVPGFTSDIYPTLLELAGASVEHQPTLDGESLVPLIDGVMSERNHPMGFWVYDRKGISTPAAKLMQQLKDEQDGKIPAGEPPALTPAARMEVEFNPEDRPGHACWIDGPWKLHRILNESGDADYRLYNLDKDVLEESDISDDHPERVRRMQDELDAWQRSVIRSLNGEDY
ncbi:MAG: N-acetylgalactosamine 6-sulfate sulfatase [Planctomycetota bacterium]|nr:MAG: N-acetylgalactosamine 6-sulfate sulfatase [Planctomycetota bacterium]REJ93729.1 MAG: N-acetylgalactosamine 6-sulfate sulfatase [Planctomycetota bacterium]REK29257.1 MAG: N-acetylgalactosamine 6-sulfate sulfatase [Planctomycetota bacterium]REK29448.1 MAG: N-acetylgalactosamine 6-sulfate sulfatase [Planctomycetota bacterium]